MKKTKIVLGTVTLGVGIIIGATLTTQAEGNALKPGSTQDPVVTKSYVDQQIAAALGQGGSGGGGTTPPPTTPGETGSQVEVVTVPIGKTLIADQGAQFVVRAGNALAYSQDVDGISDVTEGKDIKNGQAVPRNHLLLFPRDGRGIVPDPTVNKNQLVVLVTGGYTIK
ncbi:hypothetical protein [Paenibacillus sp. 1P07SE]|uniref:hypothetical protein n=1 Tax=Paenibacillus sp. 1P07SE TaxID=3132209 RepID=UPI0039A74F04